MVLIILWIFSGIFNTQGNCDKVSYARTQINKIKNSEQLEGYIQNIGTNKSCDTVSLYLIVAEMKKAEYSIFPSTKIKHFNEGKKKLEGFIASHPTMVEARFIRYMTQCSTPSILGYKSNMKNDLNFINTNIAKEPISSTFKKEILEVLKKHPI